MDKGGTSTGKWGKGGKQKVPIMCKCAPGPYTCLVIAALCSSYIISFERLRVCELLVNFTEKDKKSESSMLETPQP